MCAQKTLSFDEYFLWGENVETRSPWKRQYLDTEFLKHEKKHVEEVLQWYKRFCKSNYNEHLSELSLYTVPIELSAAWKSAITALGDYNLIGLSALYNSPQVLVIGLLPSSMKIPDHYRLLRITEHDRKTLFNRKEKDFAPALKIGEYYYSKSSQIYVDVPFEKKMVDKFIKENTNFETHITQSFQAPIMSAPYIDGAIGGISLSSLSGTSSFAEELVKSIQMMVPPEYRTWAPPKRAFNGHKFLFRNGISFRLAERPFFDKCVLSGVYSSSFSKIQNAIMERKSLFWRIFCLFDDDPCEWISF